MSPAAAPAASSRELPGLRACHTGSRLHAPTAALPDDHPQLHSQPCLRPKGSHLRAPKSKPRCFHWTLPLRSTLHPTGSRLTAPIVGGLIGQRQLPRSRRSCSTGSRSPAPIGAHEGVHCVPRAAAHMQVASHQGQPFAAPIEARRVARPVQLPRTSTRSKGSSFFVPKLAR
eukprot:CAMPEP_0179977848 /NCGR_PEP_ID=MMETSP0983-20121128/40316_1 /TAXON_ID=483367 /ORGANISM="non described non described, Strain CCMP 2436" /LENGTH=171 /DNA_ID=CAMNT_0021895139 /DNA_START=222 /DNA_END=736 /DNA_ORIENTATION=+